MTKVLSTETILYWVQCAVFGKFPFYCFFNKAIKQIQHSYIYFIKISNQIEITKFKPHPHGSTLQYTNNISI